MRLLSLVFVALSLAPGCYNPNIADGVQQCSTDGKCADGLTCFKQNNRCYKLAPACSPACSGMTPACDLTQPTPKCVGCLADKDCSAGDVCNPGTKTCRTGCSAAHPSCLADAGTCDVDAGACRGCNSDAECAAGDQANPRCDLTSGHCQPCLPTNDNCTGGKYCAPVAGGYACTDGCQTKADCKNGTAPDCCDHKCFDTATDALNCGACAKACPMGSACCAGTCSDPTSDLANCGGCGTVCPMLPNAVTGCAMSLCTIGMCNAGYGDCDGKAQNGCEANLGNDPMNCKMCKSICPSFAHATSACNNAMCSIGACAMSYADCDKNPLNGCEVNIATDGANCGACGNACNLPNAMPSCSGGKCNTNLCLAHFADCDGAPANGCERSTLSDLNNCGACGNVCNLQNAMPLCMGGACAVSMCTMGYADCDKKPADGCEIATGTDPANCGACGSVCSLPNATAGCAAGACTVAMCSANFADCNKVAGDGCEVNTAADVKNCGACGKVCSLANAVSGCAAGGCTVASCNAGFADCNKVAGDGCEANIQTDLKNCGACGVACGGGKVCKGGVCGGGSCNNTVLLLGDGSALDTSFMTALTSAGLAPTNGGVFTSYAGVPNANTFGSVVISLGNNFGTDMPAAGQTSIVNAANATTGVVFTEWAAYEVTQMHFQTLAPLLLMTRTSATGSVNITFTQTVAHPVWTGLPASFSLVNGTSANIGPLVNGGVQIASCAQCNGVGVAVRDNGLGRIVQIAHAGTWNGVNPFANDASTTLLWTNAAKWAGKCL